MRPLRKVPKVVRGRTGHWWCGKASSDLERPQKPSKKGRTSRCVDSLTSWTHPSDVEKSLHAIEFESTSGSFSPDPITQIWLSLSDCQFWIIWCFSLSDFRNCLSGAIFREPFVWSNRSRPSRVAPPEPFDSSVYPRPIIWSRSSTASCMTRAIHPIRNVERNWRNQGVTVVSATVHVLSQGEQSPFNLTTTGDHKSGGGHTALYYCLETQN